MVTLKKKVRASTLLEMIIAMVVIMVVFGIAMMIFTNVTRSALSSKKLRAAALVNDALLKAERSGTSGTEAYEVEDMKIELVTTVMPAGLISVTATATDEHGQEIFKRKKLIMVDND